MAAEENRIANLKALVDGEALEAGGKLRQGYRAVAAATGLGEEYIYQLYSGRKPNVSADSAKAIARAYSNGRPLSWFDESMPDLLVNEKEVTLHQYNTGGSMGQGLRLVDQPGNIKSWQVDKEWIRMNVKHHTSDANLCIVTGFGDSMLGMFCPGDPLLVDRGVTTCDFDGVYFFRVGDEGFIKRLQRIPGEGVLVISENPRYRDWTIKPDMDFQILAKVLKVWESKQF